MLCSNRYFSKYTLNADKNEDGNLDCRKTPFSVKKHFRDGSWVQSNKNNKNFFDKGKSHWPSTKKRQQRLIFFPQSLYLFAGTAVWLLGSNLRVDFRKFYDGENLKTLLRAKFFSHRLVFNFWARMGACWLNPRTIRASFRSKKLKWVTGGQSAAIRASFSGALR